VYFQPKPNPPISVFIYRHCVPLNTLYFVTRLTYITMSAPPFKTIPCHSVRSEQKRHINIIVCIYFTNYLRKNDDMLTRNNHMHLHSYRVYTRFMPWVLKWFFVSLMFSKFANATISQFDIKCY
jgi:hypothetical protein